MFPPAAETTSAPAPPPAAAPPRARPRAAALTVRAERRAASLRAPCALPARRSAPLRAEEPRRAEVTPRRREAARPAPPRGASAGDVSGGTVGGWAWRGGERRAGAAPPRKRLPPLYTARRDPEPRRAAEPRSRGGRARRQRLEAPGSAQPSGPRGLGSLT